MAPARRRPVRRLVRLGGSGACALTTRLTLGDSDGPPDRIADGVVKSRMREDREIDRARTELWSHTAVGAVARVVGRASYHDPPLRERRRSDRYALPVAPPAPLHPSDLAHVVQFALGRRRSIWNPRAPWVMTASQVAELPFPSVATRGLYRVLIAAVSSPTRSPSRRTSTA